MTNTITYNLTEFSKDLYLPSAYIVKLDNANILSYRETKATLDNLQKYQIPLTPAAQKLLDIITLLSPKVLEIKYNANPKKMIPLSNLLADRLIAHKITEYIHRHLGDFLQTIVQEQLPICLDLESKVTVHMTQLTLNPTILQPKIYFEQTADGLIYRLRLAENGRIWRVQDKPCVLVCNEPAWIIREQQLYRIEGINSARLKPFVAKDEVSVSKQHLKDYCQKIILPLVEKLDFEHHGFDIIHYDTFLTAELSVFYNFITQSCGIALTFDYGKMAFKWKESRLQKSFLEMVNDAQVVIHHVKRDLDQEQIYVQILQKIGLENHDNHYFEPKEQAFSDTAELINWLISYQKNLEEQGFTVKTPVIDNKTIALVRPNLSNLTATQHSDWFDLKGDVEQSLRQRQKNHRTKA